MKVMLMTVSHFPNGGAQALSESITCPVTWLLTEAGGSCMISYLTHVLSPMLQLLLLFFFFFDLKTIVSLNVSITFSTLKAS